MAMGPLEQGLFQRSTVMEGVMLDVPRATGEHRLLLLHWNLFSNVPVCLHLFFLCPLYLVSWRLHRAFLPVYISIIIDCSFLFHGITIKERRQRLRWILWMDESEIFPSCACCVPLGLSPSFGDTLVWSSRISPGLPCSFVNMGWWMRAEALEGA